MSASPLLRTEGADASPADAPAGAGRLARRLSANVAWNLGSDLAARGASLWLTLFCARLFAVADFGLLAFAQAAAQYAWLGGDAVVNSGYATREVARARAAPRLLAWDFYGARLAAAGLLTVAFGAVVLALPLPAAQRSVLLAASIFFVSYALYPDWAARGLQDFRALAAGNAACAAALVGSTVLLLRPHPSVALATALWAGSFAAGALVLAPLLARSFPLLPPRFEPRGWLRHARGSAVFSIGGVLAVGLGQAPTLLLGMLCPAREVGMFAAGFRLVSTGLGVLGILWWPVFPVLSALAPSSRPFREVFGAFFILMLGVSLPAAVVLATFPGEILSLLFGPAYAAGAVVLRLLAWALPLFATVTVLEITLLASGGELHRVRIFGLALATLVLVVVALAPAHGALGTAVALLAALTVGLAGFVVALRGTVRPAWIAGPLFRVLGLNLALGIFWVAGRRLEVVGVPTLLALGVAIYAALAVALGLVPRSLWGLLRGTGLPPSGADAGRTEEIERW